MRRVNLLQFDSEKFHPIFCRFLRSSLQLNVSIGECIILLILGKREEAFALEISVFGADKQTFECFLREFSKQIPFVMLYRGTPSSIFP